MRGGKISLIARLRSEERRRALQCGFCERELVDREHALIWIPSSGRDLANLVCDVCQVNLAAVRDQFLATFAEPEPDEAV